MNKVQAYTCEGCKVKRQMEIEQDLSMSGIPVLSRKERELLSFLEELTGNVHIVYCLRDLNAFDPFCTPTYLAVEDFVAARREEGGSRREIGEMVSEIYFESREKRSLYFHIERIFLYGWPGLWLGVENAY